MSKNPDENVLNKIFLSHAQAGWVLTHFNSELSETENTFEKMLQSLRERGTPFGQDEIARGSVEIVTHLYENLIELVLILRARGYRARELAKIIIQDRSQLRRIFRREYLKLESKLGAAWTTKAKRFNTAIRIDIHST